MASVLEFDMSIKDWLWGDNDESSLPPGSASSSEPPTPPPGTPNTPVTLEDITRGMQYAATAANTMIAHQYMQALDPFFEPMPDGSLMPRTVALQLDEHHHFQLPLVALATPRGLMLEEMNVHLTVRSEGVEQAVQQAENEGNQATRFHVTLSPPTDEKAGRDSRHVDIEMQFTALEPPESVMRLIDEYTNRIVPQKTGSTLSDEHAT